MAKSCTRRVTIYINGKEEDASGWQTFSYGKLGEVTENIRTFALPFEPKPYTFRMKYKYDSFNRMQQMTYPDGEVVSYDYDAVSNITHIGNQATMLGCGLGGTYESSYTYDNLYRLSSAGGSWDNGIMTNMYGLSMSYYPNGRINRKQLRADVLDHLGNITTKDYENLYSYPDGRNTLEQTVDQRSSQWQYFEWDHAGNMTMHRLHDECTRRLCWDEENRLQGVADCSYASLYLYDANGDRTYKLTGQYSYQNINGRYYPYAVLDNPTLYASPYVVCTPKGYTKHYYAESERVASKIGNGCLKDLCKSLNSDADFNKENEPDNPYFIDCGDDNDTLKNKMERNYLLGKKIMECTSANNINIGSKLGKLYERIGCINEKEKECYWYHPDHLGSSSWITEVGGKPIQHLHYLPWGEDFVDQRSTSWNAMHAFSAKERDTETGLSYFGARYYSNELSIWLSVDPMSGKYPSTSPYSYCRNNPVIMIDINGLFDSESRATRIRNRAAKRYGEDRVSGVFNQNTNGGKADYAFSIYGKGKNKYSRGGGTNELGGPIITADRADKVVSTRRDFRDYKESFTMAGYYREQISKSIGPDKFGYRLKLAGEKLHFDEQNFVDAAGPYLQGVALYNPLVGIPNDIKTVFTGFDIYGNQSGTLDRVVSGVDALTFAGTAIKSYKSFERTLNIINKTTTGYSAGITIKNQKQDSKAVMQKKDKQIRKKIIDKIPYLIGFFFMILGLHFLGRGSPMSWQEIWTDLPMLIIVYLIAVFSR